MVKIQFVILGLMAGILTSCFSGLNIASRCETDYDFSNIKTFEFYGWTPESDVMLEKIEKRCIENILFKEMQLRNIKQLGGGADIIVAVNVIIDDKAGSSASTYHTSASSVSYAPSTSWFNSSSPTKYSTIVSRQGKLVLKIIDNKTKKVVWKAGLYEDLSKQPESIQGHYEKTISAILKSFPVLKPAKEKKQG